MNGEVQLEETLVAGKNKGLAKRNRQFIIIGVSLICVLLLVAIIVVIAVLVPRNKKPSVGCADILISGAAGGLAVAIKGQRIIEIGADASKHVCKSTRTIDAKNVCDKSPSPILFPPPLFFSHTQKQTHNAHETEDTSSRVY